MLPYSLLYISTTGATLSFQANIYTRATQPYGISGV